MKIDEPKTPFVSEDEFKKLCEADPEYMKQFGSDGKEIEVNSQEAANDNDSDAKMEDDLALANSNMKLNMNINLNANYSMNSDDDMEG